VLFIIFLPKGVLGGILEWFSHRTGKVSPRADNVAAAD